MASSWRGAVDGFTSKVKGAMKDLPSAASLGSSGSSLGGGSGSTSGPTINADAWAMTGAPVTVGSHSIMVERALNQGAFAQVYLVRDANNARPYALKRIHYDGEDMARQIKREIRFMARGGVPLRRACRCRRVTS